MLKISVAKSSDEKPYHSPPPCRFCGKLNWRFIRDPGTHATQVEFVYCGARGPLCIPCKQTALAAWTERV